MHTPRGFDTARFLSVLPLFSDLAPEDTERIAAGCQLRRLERGDLIFRQGDPCEAFHVVVVGQVKLYVLSPTGHEKVIQLFGPGSSFAEALVFLGRPCPVNAQALADTLLVSVGRQTILDEVQRDPRLALRMLAGLSRRLHGLVADVQAYALHSGVQRVIGYLLRDERDAERDGEGQADDVVDGAPVVRTVSLPVSKATLASRLSLTPEYFSRILRELEDAGLIRVDRRDIHILDTAQLASYTG